MKIKAMVHSLNDLAEVEIVEHKDNNNVTAIYGTKKCTAIFNVFTGLYYVDDIYGVIDDNVFESEIEECFDKLINDLIDDIDEEDPPF